MFIRPCSVLRCNLAGYRIDTTRQLVPRAFALPQSSRRSQLKHCELRARCKSTLGQPKEVQDHSSPTPASLLKQWQILRDQAQYLEDDPEEPSAPDDTEDVQGVNDVVQLSDESIAKARGEEKEFERILELVSKAGGKPLPEHSATEALMEVVAPPLPRLAVQLDFDRKYRLGLEFRMRTGFPSWERDFCRLFRASLEEKNTLTAIRKSKLGQKLSRVHTYSQGDVEGVAKWHWSWDALKHLSLKPSSMVDLLPKTPGAIHDGPSFNLIADCFLYLRAFQYPTWPDEKQASFRRLVLEHLRPSKWPGDTTSGVAGLMYIEFASMKLVPKAITLVNRYGINIGCTKDELEGMNKVLSEHLTRRRLVRAAQRQARTENFIKASLRRTKITLSEEAYRREVMIHMNTNYTPFTSYRAWDKAIEALYKTAQGMTPEAAIHKRLKTWDMPLQSTRYVWNKTGTKVVSRHDRWPYVILKLLYDSPEKALLYITQSWETLSPPFKVMADCLVYLRAFHYDNFSEEYKLLYQQLVRECLSPQRWSSIKPDDTGARLYLQFATSEQLENAFATVQHYKIPLNMETMLYFMASFTKAGMADNALRVLVHIASIWSLEQLNTQQVREHCCDLLVLDSNFEQATVGQRGFRAWSTILSLGIQPDQSMLNIVLRAAHRNDMPEVVWEVLDVMRTQGMRPDSYTYLALLEDHSLRHDMQQFNALVDEIGSSYIKEKHIASKLLHVYLFHVFARKNTKSERAQLLSQMIQMYSQAHNLRPLVDIGLVRPLALHVMNTQETPPTSHALVIMISAFLRAKSETARIMEVFARFRQFVREGHPDIAPLVETDYMHNAFLLSLPQSPEVLIAAVDIIRQMLEPLPDIDISTEDGPRPLVPVRPTEQTWNILLTHFSALGDAGSIWRIRDAMAEQGVRFDIVAWNIAIGTFADRNMLADLGEAVRLMTSEGWRPDSFTVSSIRKLRNSKLEGQVFAAFRKLRPKKNPRDRGEGQAL